MMSSELLSTVLHPQPPAQHSLADQGFALVSRCWRNANQEAPGWLRSTRKEGNTAWSERNPIRGESDGQCLQSWQLPAKGMARSRCWPALPSWSHKEDLLFNVVATKVGSG